MICNVSVLPLELVEKIGYYLDTIQEYERWITLCKDWWQGLGKDQALERYLSKRPLFFRGGVSKIFDLFSESEKKKSMAFIEQLYEEVEACHGIMRGRIVTEEYLGKLVWTGQECSRNLFLRKLCHPASFGLLSDLVFHIPCVYVYDFMDRVHRLGKGKVVHLNAEKIDRLAIRCYPPSTGKKMYLAGSFLALPNSDVLFHILICIECGTRVLDTEWFSGGYPALYVDYVHWKWQVAAHRKRAWMTNSDWHFETSETMTMETQRTLIRKLYVFLCIQDQLHTLCPTKNELHPESKDARLLQKMLTFGLNTFFQVVFLEKTKAIELRNHIGTLMFEYSFSNASVYKIFQEFCASEESQEK
jgi:hypothetical protein